MSRTPRRAPPPARWSCWTHSTSSRRPAHSTQSDERTSARSGRCFPHTRRRFSGSLGHVLSPRQRKAFADIRDCRTATLGGHVAYYDCGHRVPVYNSCSNRSCPKCQGAARAVWLAEREAELLPVEDYFHVVFTLPQQLAALAV